MKKKAIFSLFVAMLLSFGMMAKSNTILKAKPFVSKKQNVIVRKSVEEKKITCECLVYTTTCGIKGIVCGSQFEMMADAEFGLRFSEAFLRPIIIQSVSLVP